MATLKQGAGFTVNQEFDRASMDIPCNIIESRGRDYVIEFLAIPDSPVSIIRKGNQRPGIVRAIVTKSAIID